MNVNIFGECFSNPLKLWTKLHGLCQPTVVFLTFPWPFFYEKTMGCFTTPVLQHWQNSMYFWGILCQRHFIFVSGRRMITGESLKFRDIVHLWQCPCRLLICTLQNEKCTSGRMNEWMKVKLVTIQPAQFLPGEEVTGAPCVYVTVEEKMARTTERRMGGSCQRYLLCDCCWKVNSCSLSGNMAKLLTRQSGLDKYKNSSSAKLTWTAC